MRALVIVIVLVRASAAFAWDGVGMWYRAANDDNPGGGGILGTGGAHDHGITCRDCHVERVDNPDLRLDFAFNPPLPMIGGAWSYVPGQRYAVTVDLRNAKLGVPCGSGFTQNVDNFAAAFEDASGRPAGLLESDSGQSAASCPADAPVNPPGTTALYADCQVIVATGAPDRDRWTFYWTAPAAGGIRLHYGAVDGDCDMMSMRDAVTVDTRSFQAPPVALAATAGALHGATAR